MSPANGISETLEKSEKESWLLRPFDFSGGIGVYRRSERRNDLRSLTGSWFGRLDTFFEGQTTLPLLSTVDTPTDISGLKTDYASMCEWVASAGTAYTYLVKGTKVYRTQTTAFGAALQTVADAQGRQLIAAHTQPGGATYSFLAWA